MIGIEKQEFGDEWKHGTFRIRESQKQRWVGTDGTLGADTQASDSLNAQHGGNHLSFLLFLPTFLPSCLLSSFFFSILLLFPHQTSPIPHSVQLSVFLSSFMF